MKKNDKFIEFLDSLVPPEERLKPITPETAEKKHPERGPCGKVSYTSQVAADKAAKNRLRKGSNTSKLRTYFCKICSSWHMSSSFRDY